MECSLFSTERPSIKVPPRDQTVLKNNDVSFTCVASAYDQAQLYWLHDGTILQHNGQIEITGTSDNYLNVHNVVYSVKIKCENTFISQ